MFTSLLPARSREADGQPRGLTAEGRPSAARFCFPGNSHVTTRVLLILMLSVTSLQFEFIGQSGFGRHAGSWDASIDALGVDVRRSRHKAMPGDRQPRMIRGAGSRNGGRTP